MQRRMRLQQRGVSIIEAMAAFLILSMGLLAFARIQSELRYGTDLSRQRAEAVRLAQENMEQLRAYVVLPTTSGLTSFDGSIASTATPVTLTLNDINTTFQLTRSLNSVTSSGTTLYKTLAVQVAWTDRRGTAQTVTLNSAIARQDPRDSGKLGFTSPEYESRSPMNRDARIPIDAVNLGGGKAGYVPPGQSFFWVFDSDSAAIVKKCTSANGQALVDNNTNNAYVDNTTYCTTRTGYLVKGFFRFDMRSGGNPSSVEPGGTACDFYKEVHPNNVNTQGNSTDCSGISNPIDLLSVEFPSNTGYSPSDITPALPKFECYDDFPNAVRNNKTYASYYCAVYVPPQSNDTPTPSWSGRSYLIPENRFGATNSTFRNCRYTADYNNNNSIDQWEHPYSYSNISYSMTGQNFLLVMGDKNCPTGSDTIGNSGLSVNYRTCTHQPAPANTGLTAAQAVSSCG